MIVDCWDDFARFCRLRFGAAGTWLVMGFVLSHTAVLILAAAIGRGADSELMFSAFFLSCAASIVVEALCTLAYERTLLRPLDYQQGAP